jgi:hypothetical protein
MKFVLHYLNWTSRLALFIAVKACKKYKAPLAPLNVLATKSAKQKQIS